jgi:hypothetical protein
MNEESGEKEGGGGRTRTSGSRKPGERRVPKGVAYAREGAIGNEARGGVAVSAARQPIH